MEISFGTEVFIARQPIFYIDESVYAYEILYRSGWSNAFGNVNGDKATTDVILNTFQTFGIHRLTEDKPAFINFTEKLISDGVITVLPNDKLVVELLEDVRPTDEVVARCIELKQLGYKIALDDFLDSPGYERLVGIADIIKIDFMNTCKRKIIDIIVKFKDYEVDYLAEKVETREDFEYAKKFGFKYYQGYFFSKPEIMKSKKIEPIRFNYLELVRILSKEEINYDELEKVISRDLSLTYNLLKLVNSSAFGFRYKITGVRHGLAALGEHEIKKWVYLMMVNDMGRHRPSELTRMSLVRARFLELVAEKTRFKHVTEEVFMLGLFSLIDVILNKPLKDVLEEIGISPGIKEVLLEGKGELLELYNMVIHYEKGEWSKVGLKAKYLQIDEEEIISSYVDALDWYSKLVDQ